MVQKFPETILEVEEESEDHGVSSRPDALALFNPVYNNGPKQYGHGRVEARWKEISPAHNIRKGMPPAVVFFGSKDKLVTVGTAEAFQSKMREVGSRSELHVSEGEGHGYFNYGRGGNKAFIRTVRQMDEFFTSLGWLSGKPSIEAFVGSL